MKVPGIPFVQGCNWSADPDGTKYGIAIHNTSNNASAANEAKNGEHRTDDVSSHFYVDKTQVIQSLDTTVKAWHSGSNNGNNNAVSVEITGTNDKSRQWWLDNVAWTKLGQVLAAVCKNYGIAVTRAPVTIMANNPKVKAFYGHDDMRRAWGGTTHTDPGPNFPWDRLFQAVNAAMGDDVSAEDVWTFKMPQGDSTNLWEARTVLFDTRRLAVQTEQNISSLRQQVATLGTALMTAVQAVAAKDFVDENALGNALAPAVAAAVLAKLPTGADQVTVEELAEAIRSLIK